MHSPAALLEQTAQSQQLRAVLPDVAVQQPGAAPLELQREPQARPASLPQA
jgi:hypothetical protein